MKTDQTELITDEQTLIGASYNSGHPIRIYDDGFGPLWISRDSMGINGIVRAQSWEDAYGICEDEFFPEAQETIEDIVKEYGFKREHVKIVLDPVRGERPVDASDYTPTLNIPFVRWETIETPAPDAWSENELFCEAFGFRPNGPRVGDTQNHGIYSKDLNGDYLDLLTPALLDELGLRLTIQDEE
jgi:hypothetical protein